MDTEIEVLGIIPARGGSKGVPRKNVRQVAGRPLIAYTLEAAAAARRLSRFVTSTDDAEIAAVAAECGSPVLRRPPELAADDTPMLRVVEHVLAASAAERGEPPEVVVLLQPTSPLRTAADIDAAVELLLTTGADSVVSVYRVEDHHPARMYRLRDGCLLPYEPEPADRLRQALPAVYHRNGAVYACRRALIEERGTLLGGVVRPYMMPRERSINIDDEVDLGLAELLLRRRAEAPAAAGAGGDGR